MKTRIIIGTRRSKLALWQSSHVRSLLLERAPGITIELKEIVTKGDKIIDVPLPKIGGKGLFTAELEDALAAGEIDIAVHSLKDLPTEMAEAFVLGAVCERESPLDAFLSADGSSFKDLKAGAVVGTSSLRRSAQLRRLRPDLEFVSIRGNVDTRIAKLHSPQEPYDAIVLACAGVDRLGRGDEITERLDLNDILPAPGQGALAVQCHANNADAIALAAMIDSSTTRAATTAERSFLAHLGAGCTTPVAAFAECRGSTLVCRGRALSPDGAFCVDVSGEAALADAEALGVKLAREALQRGFKPEWGREKA